MITTVCNRREALHWLTAAAAMTGVPALARTGTWKPTAPITYNIGVAPGGSVDLYARGIKQVLESLHLVEGQAVVPQNRPGAGGLLALQAMQKARGDAHHLATFHTGSIAGQVTGMLRADMREFVPVAMLVEETTLIAVPAASPVSSATALVEQLRRDPTGLRIAVAPLRGLNLHLALAKALQVAGVDVARLTVAPRTSAW